MKLRSKILLSVSIPALFVSGAARAQETAAQEDAAAEEQAGLEEIVVTASRRDTSQQDVPGALLVLSQERLENQRVEDLDDYLRLLPGVAGSGQGPGKKEIFIRGVSPGRTPVRIATLGSEPSVGLYFDETPISVAGRNIDLFVTDINRIEVLKGPQGTLFGASSQAGNIRYIPNKPDPKGFAAGGQFGVSTTRSGEVSHTTEAFINIPLVEDKLALRLVGYNATQGGFIDIEPGTLQLPLTNPGLGRTVPRVRDTASNANVAGEDQNSATYRGLRASLLYQINDDWQFEAQYINQSLDAEGVFEFEPALSSEDDLNAQTFTPSFGDDRVDLATWSVKGKIATLDLIYIGSYTNRRFEGQTDYTGYAAVGPFIPYYICQPGYDSCGSPELFTQEFFDTRRLTQELRIATDANQRLRGILGVFYDDQRTIERSDFTYPSTIDVGFAPNAPIPGAFASNPATREPGVAFFNDFQRDREEISVFGEVAFDITKRLTATFGARYYSIEVGLQGQSSFATLGPVDRNAGNNVDARLAGRTPNTESDVIFKGNLSYQATDDVLFYFNYAEGFRAGNFNRNGTGTDPDDIPFSFESDTVRSYEAGWRTQLFGNRLRLNGALFRTDFEDIQQSILDFSISNVTFFDNVGSARINGAELEVEFVPTDNLTIFGGFSVLDSELTELPGTLVSTAPVGEELAHAPDFAGNLGARYEADLGPYQFHAQAFVNYTSDRFASIITADRFLLEDYAQVDLEIGLSRDNWRVRLFGENLNDTVGQLDATRTDNTFRVVPTRPRTFGVKVGFDF